MINVVLKQAVRGLKDYIEIGKNSKFFNLKTKSDIGAGEEKLSVYRGF